MTALPIQRVTLADIPPDRIITIPAAGLRPIADPVALIVERVRITRDATTQEAPTDGL